MCAFASGNKNKFIAFHLSDEILDDYYNVVESITSLMPNFIPMERDNLHMTVCYLGDIYRNLRQQKNILVKDKISELENKINEFNETNKISGIIFDSFELFSEKQNLIVAKFRFASDKPNDKKQIIDLKKYFSENFFAPNEDYFEPHITLGKISGATDSDRKKFNEQIKPKLNKPNIKVFNDLTYCLKP
jgi:2'-5' RNA ligase